MFDTTKVPFNPTGPIPLLSDAEEALVLVHESVEDSPKRTFDGFALSVQVGTLGIVTVIAVLHVRVPPGPETVIV